MADITMCVADKCKDKEQCKRFKAIPNSLAQSYYDFSKGEETDKDKCEDYWELKESEG